MENLQAFRVDVTKASEMPAATYTVLAKGRAHACSLAVKSHKARAWQAIGRAPVSEEIRHEMVETYRRADFMAAVQ
mgnify:FL=1